MKGIWSTLPVAEFGASLDWATFTAPMDPEGGAAFHRFGRDYMQRERERWGEVQERKIGNYSGINTNESSFVRRAHDGHEMLIASGETANRLTEEIIAHAVPARCRRIDAQVTARCLRADWTYPERIRAAIHAARSEKGNDRRKKVALFDSDFGNSGCTIGARSSTRYVRVYDWDAKHGSGATGTLWRHEGEFKAEAAAAFFSGYSDSPNRSAYCAGVIRNTLNSMKVPCEWLADIEAVSVVVGRKVTTDEKRLAYQKKIGVPMLLQLIEAGKAAEVKALLEAHGIHKLWENGLSATPE